MVQAIKGTRDFYPEDKAIQNYIFTIWKAAATRFGFEEMDGPVLEPKELWSAKGDELSEQLYYFKDKGGRGNVLRPEMTPTVARMVAARADLSKPIKWYSIQRFFRYEAPQKGRLREFWQLNMDTLGLNTALADAELIATADTIMRQFGAKNEYLIRINSRELMDELLASLNIKNAAAIFRIIDKMDKVSASDFKAMLKEEKLSEEQVSELIKITKMQKLEELPNSEAGIKLKNVFTYLKALKADKNVILDLSIVRGLAYYTGTVFEVTDAKKELRAIAGGGRYDNLVGKYSNEKIPGVGYAMGDITLELFLKKYNLLPKIKQRIDYFIAVADEKSITKAAGIAAQLRRKYNVEMNLANRSLGKQMQYAAKKGIPRVLVVGQKDLENKCITVRSMSDGKQKTIKLTNISQI